MHGYPLLDVFWTLMWLFLWILWIFLLIRVVSDLFRSPDLGGWARAGWLVLLILLPYLGVLAYIIVRGLGMQQRETSQARAVASALGAHDAHDAGSISVADELNKLAALRDAGTLTPEEFDAAKGKLLARS